MKASKKLVISVLALTSFCLITAAAKPSVFAVKRSASGSVLTDCGCGGKGKGNGLVDEGCSSCKKKKKKVAEVA